MSDVPAIELRDVYRARSRITSVPGLMRRTPLVQSPALSRELGCELRLKLENLQPTGAFKVRGAASKLLSLTAEERRRGVVTVSTGNHGRAVAHVGTRLGIPVTVCLSRHVPKNKVEAIEALGAELIIAGESQDEAAEKAAELETERQLTLIHPFDDHLIIAGQGTMALEILDDWPELDTCLVPLSGGGLMAGVALALKSASPGIRVIGVSMTDGAAMIQSLEAGRPVDVAEEETLADSLRGGIGLDNRHTFQMCRDLVDETVQVSEDDIKRAMAALLKHHKMVVEGAGAVGIAALASGAVRADEGERVVTIVSGGNATPQPWLLESAAT